MIARQIDWKILAISNENLISKCSFWWVFWLPLKRHINFQLKPNDPLQKRKFPSHSQFESGKNLVSNLLFGVCNLVLKTLLSVRRGMNSSLTPDPMPRRKLKHIVSAETWAREKFLQQIGILFYNFSICDGRENE